MIKKKYKQRKMILSEIYNTKNRGFTLVELIIVVAIMGVLIAILAPAYARHVEKSRETVDIANVRSAYEEIRAEVMDEDASNIVKVVKLKQKRNDWQAFDPVVIAGKTHYKSQGDTDNWKGIPVANGECEVSYNASTGILFDWKGAGKDTSDTTIDFNGNLHGVLNRTGILSELTNQSIKRFEIDSKCSDSNMVNKVNKEIKAEGNSLLQYGTWAYLGSPSKDSSRYLFWTSVDTDQVGAGKKIPVIVSKADGGFYISETTTAYRNPKDKKNYVAIADHIYNDYGFQTYTKGEKYGTLKEAYEAYSKLFKEGKYAEYKDTLPK